MTKKTLKRVAATFAAVTMAVSAMGIVASADSVTTADQSHPYANSLVTNSWFSTYSEAQNANQTGTVTVWSGYVGSSYSSSWSTAYKYYNSATGKYYQTYAAACNASSSGNVTYYDSNPSYVTGQYYNTYTGKYYSSYTAACNASIYGSSVVVYTGSSYYYGYGRYYNTYTKTYYSNYADACNASIYGSSVVVDYSSSYTSGYWYSAYTHKKYSTYEAALAASNNNSAYVSYQGSSYTYPSYYYGYYPYGYGYYGYYGYGYYDPYYYYRNAYTSSTTKTTKEAEVGTAYLNGSKTVYGWTTLADYVKNAKSGQTVYINMNGATVVSSTILTAAKGNDVNVQFIMGSGKTWTVNGKDITSAKDVDLSVTNGASSISASLVDTATKGAKSYTKLTIGKPSSSLGMSADLRIKFSEKRADSFVNVYRYDEDSKSLKLVCKSVTDTNGYTSFSLLNSGEYLVVVL